jgi:hypothetical protein
LIKDGLTLLEKLQIKYYFEVFEVRNNFIPRNFFILEIDFELKNLGCQGLF